MKPQTNRQKQALATKQKIFTCALALFAKKAYETITVQEICSTAEVSVGAFYHHFKSKDDILEEGYHLFDAQTEEEWEHSHPDASIDRIRFLVSIQTNSMRKMGPFAAMQYFKNQLSCSEKYILNPSRFFYQKIQESIQSGIDSAVLNGSAAEITEEILCLTRGIIYDWGLHEGSYSLENRTAKMLDILLEHYAH
ncbi:TetR/AcrR family transcriptional regulator [Mediterraneibacter sp. ICN-202921]|uniref:TetR/AcrR family transcriptional regulator n=1 Tax=Mediterraneibacter sp. ICN-202921 TaxID=3134657 RepID=UPI0030BF843A